MLDLPKRMLLVEDNANDIELTIAALDELRLANEVFVVRDGEQALDYLFRRGAFVDRPAGQPAVVMLDVKMPKVDGIEVLRQVKTDDALKVVPVVMLTSSREERDVMQSYRQGANAYVVKPVQFQEFVNAVRDLGLFWAMINEPPPGSNGRRHIGGVA
jgi:CheY-like chemotaxis protein